MRSKSTAAFTLVELLVVIGIIGVLLGMLLPAIARVKEASKGAKCKSNLHQIGVACQLYRDAHSFYPDNPWGQFMNSAPSALVKLLPYCEYDNIANQGTNYPPLAAVPLFACPAGKNTTVYGVSAGLQIVDSNNYIFISGGVFPFGEAGAAGVYRQAVGNEDIKDGLSNTIFLGERTASGQWSHSRAIASRSDVAINSTSNPGSEFIWQSKHAQLGANFCFGDAAVRFLKESIDPQVLAALSTRKGKELVTVPE